MWHQCEAIIGKVVNKLCLGRRSDRRLRKVVKRAADESGISQMEVTDGSKAGCLDVTDLSLLKIPDYSREVVKCLGYPIRASDSLPTLK
jgi:hypothetical protein